MAQSTLEIAVSTMDEADPLGLVQRMGLSKVDVSVLIINQVADAPAPPFECGRVRMVSFAECGLARSRNRALSLATGDLLLLADNDIRYLPGFADRVRSSFAQYPSAAVLTFQFLDEERGAPAKRYRSMAREHDGLSIAGLSSIEVGLRRSALPAVRFDERFGLGALYRSGEEAIFVADVCRAGGEAYYCPVPVCSHRGPSSGHAQWDAQTVRAKGAILRRLYPRAWPLMATAFFLTKGRLRTPEMGKIAFARGFVSGALALDDTRPPPDMP